MKAMEGHVIGKAACFGRFPRPANSGGRVTVPDYFSYIAKLDDPGFSWNDLPEEDELRSEPWQGATKQEGEAL